MTLARFSFSGDVVAEKPVPVADIFATPAFAVIGSVITVNGERSYSPDGSELTYFWSFLGALPVGSEVGLQGLTPTDASGSSVKFSPDKTGFYVVQLIVYNGVFYSTPVTSVIHVKPILIPNGTGIVPDGKFIWQYLRDAWFELENREWFETLWSALIQIVGADLMRVYQSDFNKSIRDIQDRVQRRWLSYEPLLPVTSGDATFRLVEESAGLDATSSPADTLAILLSDNELRVVEGVVYPSVFGESLTVHSSLDSDNLGTYPVSSVSAENRGYFLPPGSLPDFGSDRIHHKSLPFHFSFRSTDWSTVSGETNELAEKLATDQSFLDTLTTIDTSTVSGPAIRAGDVIHVPSGTNQGFYRVLAANGNFVRVDRAPLGSDSGQVLCSVYRPVRISVTQPPKLLTETFYLPSLGMTSTLQGSAGSQVVQFSGRTLTCLRAAPDQSRVSPSLAVTSDQAEAPYGLSSQPWRIPNTLSSLSQDFEALGVRAGDVLEWVIERQGSSASSTVQTQVTGSDRNKVGFSLSTEELSDGVVSHLTDEEIKRIFDDLGIPGAELSVSGEITFSGSAKDVLSELKQAKFRRAFLYKTLSPEMVVTVAGISFKIRPSGIIRNSLIPVADDVLSVPSVQEYISSPKISIDGGQVYREVRGSRYPIYQTQNVYYENGDFSIGGRVAFSKTVLFTPGTTSFKVFGSDFLDLGVGPGDSLFIDSPSALEGEYLVKDVVSAHEIVLTSPIIPVAGAVLGEEVQADVRVVRRRNGNFLRFVKGRFYAKKPAPRRLWAESTFFDNQEAIENNFGVLVGLTRDQVNTAMSGLSYRQAVTGLLYAYTKGPTVDRVRLGVQVLLGLPYSEHRGIVRAIDDVYKTDLLGSPTQGRMMVEDVDSAGNPLGLYRSYLFPIDAGSLDLAGVDINPETGVAYAVGDVIEKFRPICKGARVLDYVNDPLPDSSTISRTLQQFHSLRVQVNDFLFNGGEVDLVSKFLQNVTPNHISAYLTSTTEEYEEVEVGQKVVNVLTPTEGVLVDDATSGVSVPQIFGGRDLVGSRYVRTDGVYTVRCSGTDLLSDGSTTALSDRITSQQVRAGDVLRVIRSPYAGTYSVLSATDGGVTLDRALPAAEDLSFAVLRRVGAELFTGTATVVGSVATVASFGPWDLVQEGDWFLFGGVRYTIVGCGPRSVSGTSLAQNQLLLLPALSGPSTGPCRIVRSTLLPRYSGTPMAVTSVAGDHRVTLSGIDDLLVEPGDYLERSSESHLVLAVSGKNAVVTPPFPTGTSANVKLRKSGAPSTPLGLGSKRQTPKDRLSVTIVSPYGGQITALSRTLTSNAALTQYNPVPGDFLVITQGGTNPTRDVGYGAGVYPIVEVDGDGMTVSHDLDGGVVNAWNIRRVR